jgi:hypothetical protein
MSVEAVFDFAEDVIEGAVDLVGDVVDVAVDVVEDVAETVGDVVENAIENPIATIGTIAAIAAAPYTGGASLNWIPAINAANTLAEGGSFEDALKSAAISYVAQNVGQYVGDVAGTSFQYGTDPLSQQTGMLAQQSGGMLGGTTAGYVGGAAGAAASGATAAALSGGDIDQAVYNALASYAVRNGVRYSINEAGKLVDEFGKEAPQSAVDEITSNVVSELDQYEVDNIGNVSQGNILGGGLPSIDPFEVDNVGNRSESQILTGIGQGNFLTDAAGKYFKNQFANALSNQILGGIMPDDPRPMGARLNRRPMSLTGAPGVSESLMDLGYSVIPGQNFTIPEPKEEGEFTPVGLWDPGISENWDTNDKLSGLGFAGKFINEEQPEVEVEPDEEVETIPVSSSETGQDLQSLSPDISEMTERDAIEFWDPGVSDSWETDNNLTNLGFSGSFINQDDYINAPAEERQRIIDEVKQRGWMTEEERAALEQSSGFFDAGADNILTDASPWYSPEYAEGGHIDHNPEFYSEGGASLANRYVRGDGDGTSDSVPAMLASGEFVIPADVVSGLGNGDNDAGAKVLDGFMAAIRSHKRSTNPEDLPPDSKGPLAYLAEAHKKAGKKYGRS